MAGEWPSARLGDCVEIKHGFAFEGRFFRDTPPGDILVTPGNFNIGGGFNTKSIRFYSGPAVEGFGLTPGDLIVTMTDLSKAGDTLGYAAFIPADGRRYLHNQRIGLVKLKAGAPLRLRFAQWLMRTSGYRAEVLGSATGSTVRHTSPSRIAAFEFGLPSLREQDAIAEALDLLDCKIELNRRMAETLEAISLALFKSWFIDFDPVHAKIERRPTGLSDDFEALFRDSFQDDELPDGWERKALRDGLTRSIVRGISPSYASQGVLVLNQKCVRGGRIELLKARHHDLTSKQIGKERLLAPGDVVINSTGVGTLGRVAQLRRAQGPITADSHVTIVKPNENEISVNLFGLSLIELQPLIETLGRGSTGQTELSRDSVADLRVVMAPRQVQNAFDDAVGPLRDRADHALAEALSLEQLRDTLLPKLISGELRVGEVEKKVSAA